MMKHQRGAVRTVMDMSLFVLFLLSGLLWSTSAFQRKYYYINQSMTWPEAQSYCRERFTDLATVDVMGEVNMMIKAVDSGYSGSVWIGLKSVTQGRWGWSTGDDSLAQYSNWGPIEPSGDGGCVQFVDGFFNDLSCSTLIKFSCYNESTGHIVIQILKTWRDAQSYCRQYHTDLSAIRNIEEQKQINSVIGANQKVWIGLFLDSWQWSDQSSRFFRNWAAGFPAASGGCVVMSTTDSGKWAHYSCDQQRPFICYEVYKKQIIRLNLSCNGNCNLNDPSQQAATLNEISKNLQTVGLGNYISLNWGKNEG